MKNFNSIDIKNRCIKWIQDWFEENGRGCNAVIGISGGVDSSVVAALCVEALGKDRVYGVIMPNHQQADIGDAYEICDHLHIKHTVVNIGLTIDALSSEISSLVMRTMESHDSEPIVLSDQTKINLPPRIRMATLYAVSQSINGRVANTCNLSEDWIGYSTRYGDSVGDFSPLSNLTKTEVKEIGRALGLPESLVAKTPTDGLCGKTDEDNFGFTYDVLDKYIRTGEIEDEQIKAKIDSMHKKNLFKLQLMPSFQITE